MFDNITITGTADAAPAVLNAASASPATVAGTTANLSAGGRCRRRRRIQSHICLVGLSRFVHAGLRVVQCQWHKCRQKYRRRLYQGRQLHVQGHDQGHRRAEAASSTVSVAVNQTFTGISINPTSPSVGPLGTQQFTATAVDQFGLPMANQPAISWSITSGSGAINSSGLYTAALSGASATIRATSGSLYGSTTVSIVNQSPLVSSTRHPAPAKPLAGQIPTALSVLGADDAGESNLIYTWSVVGTPPAAVAFIQNGTNAAKNTTVTFTKAGTYNLQVAITDAGGLSVSSPLTVAVLSTTVVGRMIFYNNSDFDGHAGYLSGDPAANLYDDNAIATDKTALLPGQTASFANYTSYSRGINGIMIDIQNMAGTPSINNYTQFFGFKVGNDSNAANWSAAPAPIAVDVSPAAARERFRPRHRDLGGQRHPKPVAASYRACRRQHRPGGQRRVLLR